jgi:hypothetical protein
MPDRTSSVLVGQIWFDQLLWDRTCPDDLDVALASSKCAETANAFGQVQTHQGGKPIALNDHHPLQDH